MFYSIFLILTGLFWFYVVWASQIKFVDGAVGGFIAMIFVRYITLIISAYLVYCGMLRLL